MKSLFAGLVVALSVAASSSALALPAPADVVPGKKQPSTVNGSGHYARTNHHPEWTKPSGREHGDCHLPRTQHGYHGPFSRVY